MISTEKKKKIDERCKALEKEFERRYKKETEVRGKKCFAVSFSVPAFIPSGRSVVSRNTRTGFPRDGASSCIPPLSVIIK